jgi:uncharacterized protein YggE
MVSSARLFAIALLLAAGLAAPAAAQDTVRRTITLSGIGETMAGPDLARVTSGVQSEAKTAREALTANNRAMTAVIDGLKQAGIADKDIQTSNFSVGPRYEYPPNARPVLVGYQVSNTVTVTVRDLAKIGELLDRIVTLGSNTINGIGFSIDDPEKLEDEARRLALADARRKAELYAAAGGFRLGRILTVAESSRGGPQPPVPFMRAAKMDAAESVPIQGGEQSVAIQVSVTWEIE